MRKRGFTIIEILVACMIGAVVSTLAISLYVLSIRRHSSDVGLYELEVDVAQVIDLLRSDLRETNLGSVVVKDNALSFAAATPLGEINNFQLSEYGAPKWQKQVFYGLQPTTEEKGLSRLVRYESKSSEGVPRPWSGDFPDPEGQESRILSRHLLSKGYSLKKGDGGLLTLQPDDTSTGGFDCRFVTRKNELVTERPEPEEATRLVQLQLTLVASSPEEKIESTSFSFRVFPRN